MTTSAPARAASTFAARHAALLRGGPGRLAGVDLARGVAVLGMFAAHVGVATAAGAGALGGAPGGAGGGPDEPGDPWWLALSHGRSSVLFAVVAGISVALVTGRDRPLVGLPLLQARTRLLVRAAMLLGIVAVLDLLGTTVLLILGFYAACFVLVLPFLRWSPQRLLALALGVAVLGPPLTLYGPEALARWGLRLPRDGSGAATDFLLTGHYPSLVWMAYVLAGLAVGRLDLASRWLQTTLLAGGTLLAAGWYALSGSALATTGGAQAVQAQVVATSSRWAAEPYAWDDPWPSPAALWLAGPHTDTTPEVLGSGGFALAVVGACLLLGALARTVLAPVAAVGACALSVYALQIVALAVWPQTLGDAATNGPLLWLVVVTLVAATAWRWAFGRGPLERALAAVAGRAASATSGLAAGPPDDGRKVGP